VLWDIEVPLVREDTPAFQVCVNVNGIFHSTLMSCFQEQEALLVPLATKATEVRLVREDSQEQEVNRAALVPTAEMGALVLRARLGREAPSAPEASLVFPVVQVRSTFDSCLWLFFASAGAVTPNAGASSAPLQGTTTGLFARWFRAKFQRLPAESWFESATLARLTTVPNLNFPSTDDAFANSGLKSDYAARFEGYPASICVFTASWLRFGLIQVYQHP
jgi:hypothetical protein